MANILVGRRWSGKNRCPPKMCYIFVVFHEVQPSLPPPPLLLPFDGTVFYFICIYFRFGVLSLELISHSHSHSDGDAHHIYAKRGFMVVLNGAFRSFLFAVAAERCHSFFHSFAIPLTKRQNRKKYINNNEFVSLLSRATGIRSEEVTLNRLQH